MKIEIYVKNRDLELVAKHMEKFLAKHLKGKNKIELKKITKIDKINRALSEPNYQRIINFYVDDNLTDSALTHLTELSTINIIVSFKYGDYGNLILVNHNKIMEFIQKVEASSREVINKLYQ